MKKLISNSFNQDVLMLKTPVTEIVSELSEFGILTGGWDAVFRQLRIKKQTRNAREKKLFIS